MAESLFLGYSLLVMCILQWALAGALAWVPRISPARAASVALLFFNGGVAVLVSLRGFGFQTPMLNRLATVMDGPTGALVLLLAFLVWKRSRLDDLRWTMASAAGFAAIGAAFLLTMGPLLRSDLAGVGDWRIAYQTVPVFLGYAAILAALSWKTVQAPRDVFREYWFVLLGFGARAAEFAAFYGAPRIPSHLREISSGDIFLALDGISRLALILSASVSASLLVVAAVRRRERRPELVLACFMLFSAACLGLLEVSNSHEALSWYSVSLVTLFLVRAVFLGLAFERRRTLHVLGASGVLSLLLIGTKMLLGVWFGWDWQELHTADFLAPVFVAFAAIMGYGIYRSARPVEAAPPAPTKPAGFRFPNTPDGRIARHWLLGLQGSPPKTRFSHQELCQVAGIKKNQLATYLRILRSRLEPGQAGQKTPNRFWHEEQADPQSPKQFILDAESASALERVLQPGRPR